MKPAPLPPNESERLHELLSLEILDTRHESQFDEIVQLASHICEAPISLVTLVTLVDESRQWFKARVGLDVTETSRDASFCAHTEPLLTLEMLAKEGKNGAEMGDTFRRIERINQAATEELRAVAGE